MSTNRSDADVARAMPLGLIAGSGAFPGLVLRAARESGHDVVLLAIVGEASVDLERLGGTLGGTTVHWIQLGDLAGCIRTLRANGVTRAVMAGQVRHTKLFGSLAPDPALAAVLARVGNQNTDALISAVAAALGEHGIALMDSTALLFDRMAGTGVLSRRPPSSEMLADFAFGYRMADLIAGADIGQTVVVKDRAVVAVEAMEGTDAAIDRAGRLAGPGARIVKVSKPAQDMRFDVPVVGIATVNAMVAAGADALSIDGGRTLVLDGDGFLQAADRAGIVVVGRERT